MADNLKNLEKNLENANKSVMSVLRAENSYKSSAWVVLIIMLIGAFFISLGNASFDWSKILEAQFWIDFSITFFGSQFIKFIWGKWGDAEGHRHPDVINMNNKVYEDNQKIEDRGLMATFEDYLDASNQQRKLKAIKRKTFIILRNNSIFRKRKKWKEIKDCIIKAEKLILKPDCENAEEIKTFLDEHNFDLETFAIKYNTIKKDTLQTGFSTPNEDDDESMSYDEFHQLFGRNIYITLISFIITVLLAVTSVIMNEITLAVVWIFATRVIVFIINAYVGFSTGKTGVEKVKLNVLSRIHKFLGAFLELHEIKHGGEVIGDRYSE